MKTTLIIPDDLVRQLKKKAADTKRTLSDVVADALHKGLMNNAPKKKPRKLPTFSMGEAKVDISDRDALYRAMEGK